jgi:hypothetical protein
MSLYLIAHIGHSTKWQEHISWWKPESRGYTICVDKAGRYSEAEARSICQHGECIAVPVDVAESLALSTPYYRRPNGTLAELYDGGPHRPVPNSREAWKALTLANIVSAPRWSKPTPIGTKARAIYLDGLSETVPS